MQLEKRNIYGRGQITSEATVRSIYIVEIRSAPEECQQPFTERVLEREGSILEKHQ